MRRKPASPEAATPAEVWENMKNIIFKIVKTPKS